MDTGPSETSPDAATVQENAHLESGPRKGKRKPDTDQHVEEDTDDVVNESAPKAKRSKRSERPPPEPKVRPVRERRQSSYSISLGFLDDKAFEDMEAHSSKVEQRRAAFYDTQSYRA